MERESEKIKMLNASKEELLSNRLRQKLNFQNLQKLTFCRNLRFKKESHYLKLLRYTLATSLRGARWTGM